MHISIRILCSLFLLAALGLMGCPSSGPAPQKSSVEIDDEVFDHFFELAFQRNVDAIVPKWSHDVRVALDGSPTEVDVETVKQTLKLFSALSQTTSFSLDSRAPHVTMHFALKSDFPQFTPFVAEISADKTVIGLCNLKRGYNQSPRKSVILIDITRLQAERQVVIRHELMHMLGFQHSDKKTSILYPTTDGGQTLSHLDRGAVELLHSRHILPGMRYREVLHALGKQQ